MRPVERDVLLFLLAATAGSADAWSYFGLGHAFVANMTGNTVLVGLAVFQLHGDMFHPLLSLACYAVGVLVASLLTRGASKEMLWSKAVSWTLLLEGVLIAAAEAGWLMIHRGEDHASGGGSLLSLNLLLGIVALGIGLQSGAMIQLKVPGVVTTYITGTWTTLMNGLARFATEKRHEQPAHKRQDEERLLMQAGILAVYFLSAVLTGWLFRYAPVCAGALSAVPVLFVAVYGIVRT
jgi:uncharacterized membrane protein YoaK (UPF0700 family)